MWRWICIFLFLSVIGCQQPMPRSQRYAVGRDPSWFPLEIDQHAVSLNAFTDAAFQEIAKSEHIPFNIINTDWSQLFQGLAEEKYAGIFSSLSPNVISKMKYVFSDPFLMLGPVLVVPIHSTATSLADLEQKTVAVNQYDDSVLIVQRLPSIVIKLYENKAIALEDLVKGHYDAVLLPILDAQSLIPTTLFPTENCHRTT